MQELRNFLTNKELVALAHAGGKGFTPSMTNIAPDNGAPTAESWAEELKAYDEWCRWDAMHQEDEECGLSWNEGEEEKLASLFEEASKTRFFTAHYDVHKPMYVPHAMTIKEAKEEAEKLYNSTPWNEDPEIPLLGFLGGYGIEPSVEVEHIPERVLSNIYYNVMGDAYEGIPNTLMYVTYLSW